MSAEAEPSSVVVLGAATMDIKGRTLNPLNPGTSNRGHIRLSLGGAARNVAENLARLGVPTSLLTAVGDDAFGMEIVQRTAAAGVDTSGFLVLPDQRSATYTAILDDTGRMVVSVDDMHICEALTPQYVRVHAGLLRRARMIVLDANLSPRSLSAVLAVAKQAKVPVCVDPVSMELAERVKPHLCDYAIVTPNGHEAAVLCDSPVNTLAQAALAARKLVACGVRIVVITLGQEGLFYATAQTQGHIPATRCPVVDATGAGDALTAGVVYGLVNDLPLDECMRLGVSAAAITLASAESVSPEMSLERVYEGMAG
jgi:pseudouridine kinase